MIAVQELKVARLSRVPAVLNSLCLFAVSFEPSGGGLFVARENFPDLKTPR